jgi:hypothetical protein
MTSALRVVQVAGDTLENEVCRATWQPLIIKSAGDPVLLIGANATAKEIDALKQALQHLGAKQV